jgi:hypothetical protein
MPPGELNLLFDQVEVVEKPFGGGSDAPAWIYGERRAIESPEALLVSIQSGQQAVGAVLRDELVIRRQGSGMARELFDAEQLGPQRRLARARARTHMSGHPVLKAQRQSLHVDFASGRDSCN